MGERPNRSPAKGVPVRRPRSLSVLLTSVLGLTLFYSALSSRPGAEAIPAAPSTLLLETGPNGEVSAGSVEALRDAVRAGAALRVGWEFRFRTSPEEAPVSLEHWADAGFLTIWHDHVFAQIRDIHTQGPELGAPAIHLGKEPHGWTALLGSNGTLTSVFAGGDPNTEAVVTRWAVAQ